MNEITIYNEINRIEGVYKCYVLIVLLVKAVPLISQFAFVNFLAMFSAVLGVALIVLDIVRDKRYFQKDISAILCVFAISYSITIIVNNNVELVKNIEDLIWFIICITVFMHFDKDSLKPLISIFLCSTFIIALLSISCVFFKAGGISDAIGPWGYLESAQRLVGIYRSPNYGALYCVLSIIISIIILNKRTSSIKILLYMNIVMEFLYICYSGSNTGKVILVLGIVLLILYKAIIKRNFQEWMKYISQAVLAGGLLVGCIYIINYFTARLLSSYGGVGHEMINFVRQDYVEGSEIGNGRFLLWHDALQVFKHRPLWGTSMRGYGYYVEKFVPEGWNSGDLGLTIHNDFVSCLTCCGIIGLIVFVIAICKIMYVIIKTLKFYCKDERFFSLWSAFIIVAIIGCTMVFSDAILFSNTIQSFIFWITIGYLLNWRYYDERSKRKN